MGTKPRRGLARRLALAALALLALLAAGQFLVWRWTTRQIAADFALAMEQRRAQGWTVRHDTPQPSGWPLAATLRVPGLSMSYDGPDLPGGLAWSTDRLLLTIAPMHPRTLLLRADGRQTLRLAGLPDIPFTADRLVVSVALEPGVPARDFLLDVENLRAGIPNPGGSAALEIARLHGHAEARLAAPQGEPALNFGAEARGLGLPQPAGAAWALGRTIASLSLDGAVDGPWPRASGAIAPRIAGWRDGGGAVEIRHLAAAWGPLDLTATATLALDAQMQPMGAANARVTGQAETLDALAAGRVITAGVARTAKVVLAMMARLPEGGGPPMVEVPLTLQQRSLEMGRIPLAKFPELVWPAAP